MGLWTFPARIPVCSSAQGTGAFPAPAEQLLCPSPPATSCSGERLCQGCGHRAGCRVGALGSLLCPEPLQPPCPSLLTDASWLPIYKESEDAVNFILAFVSSLDKVTVASWTVAVLAFAGLAGQSCLSHRALHSQCSSPTGCVHPPTNTPCLCLCQDTHKFTFLKSTYVMCKTALKRGLTQGLDLFCQTCEVVENIKVRGWAHPVWCSGDGHKHPWHWHPVWTLGWVRDWVLPGLILVVLCRTSWKRSQGTGCPHSSGISP